ncbi:DUF4037 domain-containing protein [uncultured Desulfovibrio sp.]|uniref:DUF4037 domain-containing protein n=1 Tax=uncultured Desulfovibrio sp. TaxID=167968 RepID=UPI002632D709|nr:DUF4037 domain-containing protein [uncultured Desulfovibrio sp.]
MMQGLELSRRYFEACLPLLQEQVGDILPLCAVGLAGEGSECLGFDDATSRDHDWGPGFCIWLSREDLARHRQRLEDVLRLLPGTFEGFPCRMTPERRKGRTGPMAMEDFYARFTGRDTPPSDWRHWLGMQEWGLATCTNGEVFFDGPGRFSAWRTTLLDYFPRDLHLKKMATRCMQMAQAGQYNLPRCLERGDSIGAMLALGRFSEAALSLACLLNRRYLPFYKWAWRTVQGLPRLGADMCTALQQAAAAPLTTEEGGQKAVAAVEDICALVAAELRRQGLSDEQDSWLWLHGPIVMGRCARWRSCAWTCCGINGQDTAGTAGRRLRPAARFGNMGPAWPDVCAYGPAEEIFSGVRTWMRKAGSRRSVPPAS